MPPSDTLMSHYSATLCRILKYTPALVLGLLVVAWAASVFVSAGASLTAGNSSVAVTCFASRIQISWMPLASRSEWAFSTLRPAPSPDWFVGKFGYVPNITSAGRTFSVLMVPIPFILTLQLPLAIGPFLSYRFRLWHYLAYTALVAVELAYYLRWQE